VVAIASSIVFAVTEGGLARVLALVGVACFAAVLIASLALLVPLSASDNQRP
jgi:hypothetical protein